VRRVKRQLNKIY